MIFVDKVNVTAVAGKGGDGKLSFRHEIYLPKGGPDGGDGGNGGDIIFTASRNQNTLTAFRYKKELKAENGTAGAKRKKHGKSGQDLIVLVPVGTVVINSETNKVLSDLVEDGQSAVIAKGGEGGFGNAHFVSSTRQTPNFAEKGASGETVKLTLELKMIADVGIVGLPNAGKSTFLARVSNAHPEIANYPFTTLSPNLGVADIDKTRTILLADIPGLIKGAAKGKGLGHDFLRHIERTSVILHLIDVYNENAADAYQTIRAELEAYQPKLIKRPEIVALTKIEGLDIALINDQINKLKSINNSMNIFPISSRSGQNIQNLMYELDKMVQKSRKTKLTKKIKDTIPVIRLTDNSSKWSVKKSGKRYIIRGQKLEDLAEKTDFSNYQAVNRLKDVLRRSGVMHELRRKGIKPDEIVQVGENEEQSYIY